MDKNNAARPTPIIIKSAINANPGDCAGCGYSLRDDHTTYAEYLITGGWAPANLGDGHDDSQECFPVGPRCAKRFKKAGIKIIDFAV